MSPEEIKKAITRREFLASLVPVFSIPVLLWWLLTGKRSGKTSGGSRYLEIQGEIPSGVSFHKDVVIIKEKDSIKAFRSKCTHLGCSIRKVEGDQLVCACHGSRFSLDGQVLTGPAREPLEELQISRDDISGTSRIGKG